MPNKNAKLRPICSTCGERHVAVNRYVDEQVYYRKKCDSCIRASSAGKTIRPKPPLWVRAGYKKKERCEICSFKAKIPQQLLVFHVDGDTTNVNWVNLKTVCANCQIELAGRVGWRPAEILPDF
jgi:hypothetical protein